MTDTSLGIALLQEGITSQLEALTGEDLRSGIELQELLEKRLGIHFTTTLLSFELDQLATFDPARRALLQQRILSATADLADFYEMNYRLFEKQRRVWMPVRYLP